MDGSFGSSEAPSEGAPLPSKNLLYNGDILPSEELRLSPTSDYVHYGYGVFETILYEDGILYFFGEHCRRLLQSAKALSIAGVPMDGYSDLVRRLIRCNNNESERLKIKIILMRRDRATSDVVVVAEQLPLVRGSVALASPKGFGFVGPSPTAPSMGFLRRHKTCNLMQSIQLRDLAREAGADDYLVHNQEHLVVEAGFANLAFAKNNVFYFVGSNAFVLPGITQSQVLLRVGGKKLFDRFEARDGFELRHLLEADEVFYLNALCHGCYVESVDGVRLAQQGYAKRIASFLRRAES